MNNRMISKIEKAKRYAEERTRIHFDSLAVTFEGDNGTHHVTFDGTVWHCDCNFFEANDTCCHTMAMERVLDKMVPAPALIVT